MKTELLKIGVAVLLAAVLLRPAQAAETFIDGNIINVTSSPSGLMIILDAGVPQVCEGHYPWPWLLIKQEDSAMIATALGFYMAGRRHARVHVYNPPTPGIPCVVSQFNPTEE